MTTQTSAATRAVTRASIFHWLGILGILGLLVNAVVDLQRMWANLLLAGVYVLGLGLGGLYFVAIHYAAGAGWATAFRRIPEAMMGLVPVGSGLVLLAVFGGGRSLYPWMAHEEVYGGFKGLWLTPGFFYVRTLPTSLSSAPSPGGSGATRCARTKRRREASGVGIGPSRRPSCCSARQP